jgi:tetratricopeptide (TPR) repeat protein
VAAVDDTLVLGPSEHELDRVDRAQGTVVGRYVIARRIGRGATSIVYAAVDPELDRMVALKLIATDPGHSVGNVADEARALAAINHRNIVAVYDVGTTADGATFIAMELVRGKTLSAWRHTRPSHAARRRVLADAGRGLLAAHEAGLVHRDIKPDNVMISDAGQVLVVDFGLAAPTRQTPAHGPNAEDSGSWLIVGTPAFMAPEQFSDGSATAASDQFSFCVVAWELLMDERPFGDGPVGEIQARCRRSELSRPRPRHIRRSLWRALLRGLDPAPERRWPSLAPLVAELERAPALRNAATLVAVGGLAVAGTYYAATRPDGRCIDPMSNASRSWDDARRDAVTARSRGGAAVARRADDYATRLGAAWSVACETSAGGNAASFADAASCLEARDAGLTETVDAALADPALTDDAVIRALRDLPDPQRCLTDAAGRPPPPPQDQREAVARLQEQLDRARRASALRRFADAQAGLDAIEDEVRAHGYRPQLAELTTVRALIRAEVEGLAAIGDLEQAYAMAVDARAHASAFEAASQLALQHASFANNAEAGMAWVKVARAHLPSTDLGVAKALQVDQIEAMSLSQRGDHDAALEAFRVAVERADRELPSDHAHRFVLHSNLGVTYGRMGRYDEARVQFELARAGMEEHYGVRGLAVAHHLGNEAAALFALADIEGALCLLERSIDIFESELGPEDTMSLVPRNVLAWGWFAVGDLDAAVSLVEGTVEVIPQRFGRRHPITGEVLWRAGWILARAGDLDGAEAAARGSDDALRDEQGNRTSASWRPLLLMGRLALARGRPRQAVESLGEAAQRVRADELAEPSDVALIDVAHGLALSATGDDARGLALAIPAARLLWSDPPMESPTDELVAVLDPGAPLRVWDTEGDPPP